MKKEKMKTLKHMHITVAYISWYTVYILDLLLQTTSVLCHGCENANWYGGKKCQNCITYNCIALTYGQNQKRKAKINPIRNASIESRPIFAVEYHRIGENALRSNAFQAWTVSQSDTSHPIVLTSTTPALLWCCLRPALARGQPLSRPRYNSH